MVHALPGVATGRCHVMAVGELEWKQNWVTCILSLNLISQPKSIRRTPQCLALWVDQA